MQNWFWCKEGVCRRRVGGTGNVVCATPETIYQLVRIHMQFMIVVLLPPLLLLSTVDGPRWLERE